MDAVAEGHILIRSRFCNFCYGMPGMLPMILAVFLLIPAPSQARVFQRSGSGGDILASLNSSGGSVAYKSEVTINGGTGQLTVMGFKSPFPAVLQTLRRATGIQELAAGKGHHLHAIVKTNKGVLRLLAFHLAGNNQTIVVAVEQSRAEFRASERAPRRNVSESLPSSYPNSSARFFMQDAETGTSVAVFDTKATVGAVEAHLVGNLRGKGWNPALPPTSGRKSGTSFTVFMKGLDVCCAYVGPSSEGRGNIITILHKKQNVK